MNNARRNAYDAAFKLKAIDLAVQQGNRAAARKLGVGESMVRRWRRQREVLTQCKKTTKAFRGNKSRWPELENILEDWVTTQREDGRGVSTMQIRLKAKNIATEMKIEGFTGGPSWCFRFMRRKSLFVGARKPLSQQLPPDYEEKNTNFRTFTQTKIAENTIGPDEIINMDEVPLAFDLPLTRTVKNEDTAVFSHEPVPSITENPNKKPKIENDSDSLNIMKTVVVLLPRLPDYKISALRPPTPQQFYSECDSLTSSDSDMQWKPEDDSGDSDFSVSDLHQRKPTGRYTKRTPVSQRSINSNEASQQTPADVSSTHCSKDNRKDNAMLSPKLPVGEVSVDMIVLAKKLAMQWQRGKILEIVTKEDGRVKYKVKFEGKGKSLVSGHHIAFDSTPKLDQLYIGARVVVETEENLFQTGILAELPGRKNRSRFLVFLDNQVPLYTSLPSLHLVCKPLEDTLGDIAEGPHKSFLTKYLKDWPYPHLTHYSVEQNLNIELNGVQEVCEVQMIDCSLMQVVFQSDQHTEWIHRGSIRVEHIARCHELNQTAGPLNNNTL